MFEITVSTSAWAAQWLESQTMKLVLLRITCLEEDVRAAITVCKKKRSRHKVVWFRNLEPSGSKVKPPIQPLRVHDLDASKPAEVCGTQRQ